MQHVQMPGTASRARWHPYWMWMRDTHDPDYPEFYLPKPGHPHLHYEDQHGPCHYIIIKNWDFTSKMLISPERTR